LSYDDIEFTINAFDKVLRSLWIIKIQYLKKINLYSIH
jgi:hypothetical protein